MNQNDEFFDLQINGYAGVDFNADGLDGEALHAACERLRSDGVAGILATIITGPLERMTARLANLVTLRRRDPVAAQVIAGIHLEGPFISAEPGYVGAHPPAAVRPADPETMQRLLDAADGLTRIVTLAPENDHGLRVTQRLAQDGIIVAAGHCNPTFDQLHAAVDAGLSMFTHLGNGCPGMLPRHDNIIQRALALADRLTVSFIADGAHVPFFALGNYLRLFPAENVVIVSDAISAAGCGPGTYVLGTQTVKVGDDLVPRMPDHSTLAGSACTMRRMADNLRRHLGATDAQIRQWLADNPRRVLARTI
ncbi:MAG TPA: N-acetylglucosamine-6-phosphate deacetylase [Thermoguttaceae bacterium]|nr:N-acetylglucosamine-6-phosphate deacetylase [Thermoguttaceae bacterium]